LGFRHENGGVGFDFVEYRVQYLTDHNRIGSDTAETEFGSSPKVMPAAFYCRHVVSVSNSHKLALDYAPLVFERVGIGYA
jgi:hypothetical protein